MQRHDRNKEKKTSTKKKDLMQSASSENLGGLLHSVLSGKSNNKPIFDDDDDASVASAGSFDSNLDGGSDGEITEKTDKMSLSEALELVSEKRSASRRAVGLKKLINLLGSTYFEAIEQSKDTAVMYLCNCIKRGESEEVMLAAQALSLVALTLGDDESILDLSKETLTDCMKARSRSGHIRAAAINCLSIQTYLHASHDEDSLAVMDLLLSLLPPGHSSSAALSQNTAIVDVALFDSWGLLASTLPLTTQASLLAKHLPMWQGYLRHESVDVRTSVGEDIAMLFQAMHDLEEVEADLSDEDVDKSTRRSPASFSTLLDELRILSTDSSRRLARKDRKEQRANFREIVASAESGEVPSFVVTIHKIKHEVVGWLAIKQWHALTDVFGASLPAHIQSNPIVHSMVGWEQVASAAYDDGLDDRERRAQQKLQSKAKAKLDYQAHNKVRAKKMAHTLVD